MKKSYVLLFGLLFLFSSSVSAHTGLESSSPADGATVTEQIQDISLTFETVIEDGSSFTLSNESGNVPVENIAVIDNVLNGSTSEPLDNGAYTVDWRIIGEDGHLIEGTYGFTVSAEPAPETEVTGETPENKEMAEEAPADVQEEDESTPVVPIMLGAIVAALIAAMLLVRKGKK